MRMGYWMIRMVVSIMLSYVGWWLGAFVGVETAFIVSTIFGGFGLWYGARVGHAILG
jgi:hypothetical protein